MTKDFKDMSPMRWRLALVLITASLALVAAAQRDIQHRSDAEVRGSRPLWRLLCLNALGAAGYFVGTPKDIDTFPIGIPETQGRSLLRCAKSEGQAGRSRMWGGKDSNLRPTDHESARKLSVGPDCA